MTPTDPPRPAVGPIKTKKQIMMRCNRPVMRGSTIQIDDETPNAERHFQELMAECEEAVEEYERTNADKDKLTLNARRMSEAEAEAEDLMVMESARTCS